MKIQVLMSSACNNGLRAADLVKQIVAARGLAADVETIVVSTAEDAARLRFPGSPTVRVDGVDIDPNAPTDAGLG